MRVADTHSLSARIAKNEDLPYILALHNKNKKNLGFLPGGAFVDAIHKNRVIIVLSDKLILGYVLYYIKIDAIKIVHFCIDQTQRRKGIASFLLQYLEKLESKREAIILNCRKDFEAAVSFWKKSGFQVVKYGIGRGKDKSELYTFKKELNESSLFSEKLLNSSYNCLIDFNIFIDLCNKDKNESSLLLQYEVESDLSLFVCNAIMDEIDKNNNRDEKIRLLEIFKSYYKISVRDEIYKDIMKILRDDESLKGTREADLSYIAYAVASNMKYLITRDNDLLRNKSHYLERYNIDVMSPISMYLVACTTINSDDNRIILSSDYEVSSLSHIDYEELYIEFSLVSESKSNFGKYITKMLKARNVCVIKDDNKHPIAIMNISMINKSLEISNIRLSRGAHRQTVNGIIINHAINEAVESRIEILRIETQSMSGIEKRILTRKGFVLTGKDALKLLIYETCFAPNHCSQIEVKTAQHKSDGNISREEFDTLNEVLKSEINNSKELETLFWPIKIFGDNIKSCIIPISKSWARELLNIEEENANLFLRDSRHIRNERNVYFSMSAHSGLIGTSRIAWYISASGKRKGGGYIGAYSICEAVEAGEAKILFKKYNKYGVFDISLFKKAVGSDLKRKVTAFVFKLTEICDKKVSYGEIKRGCESPIINANIVTAGELIESDLARIYTKRG